MIVSKGIAEYLIRIEGKKVKFALEEAVKTQRGSRGIVLLFL
jgi:hypothetical protein